MSDLAIAGLLLAFLVGLAVAAPIWGVDSRDGFESDEPARRVTWLHGRHESGRVGASPSVAVAGTLRSVAYRLDAQAATPASPDDRLARAC